MGEHLHDRQPCVGDDNAFAGSGSEWDGSGPITERSAESWIEFTLWLVALYWSRAAEECLLRPIQVNNTIQWSKKCLHACCYNRKLIRFQSVWEEKLRMVSTSSRAGKPEMQMEHSVSHGLLLNSCSTRLSRNSLFWQ